MEEVSRTALSVAAHRALESERDGALFDDPWASALAGDAGFRYADEIARASSLPVSRDMPGMFAVRTRFYDDALATATVDARQVVVLAAGMDTRAHRLPWPAGTTLYEVDRAVVFEYKERILETSKAVARCERCVVATDLRTDWTDALLDAGFSTGHPTVWTAEGLLYYLTDDEVARLLDDVWQSSPAGSVLVTDVAPTMMRDAPTLARWRELLASFGEPFRSFSDDGASLLHAHGWDVTSARSIAEVAADAGYTLPAVGALGVRRLLVARKS